MTNEPTTPEVGGECVYVEVSGPTGSGKSAVMGEIEIALRALGLTVEHDADFQAEKNGTHADWQAALDLYRPTVVIRERNISRLVSPPAVQEEGFTPVTGLWKDLSLSRIERAKAHRMQFGSDLKTAIAAVDEEETRKALVAKATPSPAIPDREEIVGVLRDFLEPWEGLHDVEVFQTCENQGEAIRVIRARSLLAKLAGKS